MHVIFINTKIIFIVKAGNLNSDILRPETIYLVKLELKPYEVPFRHIKKIEEYKMEHKKLM